MKRKIKSYVVLLMSFLLISSIAFASFPAKKSNNSSVADEQVVYTKDNLAKKAGEQITKLQKSEDNSPEPDDKKKDKNDEKLILILLWLFLGIFAAHRWYKKKPVGWNILFILTIGGCGVWAIIDLVNILMDEF